MRQILKKLDCVQFHREMCDLVIKQLYDGCGCNSSKCLAFDNGNDHMNHCTRPGQLLK